MEDKEAKAREMMIASLAVAMKTESGIGILHTDGGTEIEKEPENTGKEIATVTGLRGKSVTVTATVTGVTGKGGIETVTRGETARDARNVRREKTEINRKNNEKKKDTVRRRAQKRPAARKRESWCQLRKRAEELASQRNRKMKILNRERKVSVLLHRDHVDVVWRDVKCLLELLIALDLTVAVGS